MANLRKNPENEYGYKARIKRCARGLPAHAVLEKFAAVQLLGVLLPTTDGYEDGLLI